jgi:hypothetical protein
MNREEWLDRLEKVYKKFEKARYEEEKEYAMDHQDEMMEFITKLKTILEIEV